MSGLGVPASITPKYTSLITFDSPLQTIAQKPFWLFAEGSTIATKVTPNSTLNMVFNTDLGWMLGDTFDVLNQVHEQGLVDSSSLSVANGNASTPSGFLQFYSQRWQSELTGVPQGNQTVQGDTFARKVVKALDDWASAAYRLITDQGAYPPPTPPVPDTVPMDRVLVGNAVMNPDQGLMVRFSVPGSGGASSIQRIMRIYFTGMPSSNSQQDKGTGQYALTLYGDGTADLSEVIHNAGTSPYWGQRFTFTWCTPHSVTDSWHVIKIHSDAIMDNKGLWASNCIVFSSQTASDAIGVLSQLGHGEANRPTTTTYVVSNALKLQPVPIQPRVDIRRDVRAAFQLSYSLFFAQGKLQTKQFTIPFEMGAVGTLDLGIGVSVFGNFPASTSVSIALYGADGTAATLSGTQTTTLNACSQAFNRIANQRSYYAIITCNSNAPYANTPIIKYLSVVRNALLSTNAITPFIPKLVSETSVMKAASDPTTETAAYVVDDLTSTLTQFVSRSGHSVLHEIYTDPAFPTQSSTIFMGKVSQIHAMRRGTTMYDHPGGVLTARVFPDPQWSTYKVICNGVYARLMMAKTTQTYSFGSDYADVDVNGKAQPYKITKIIKILLQNAGVPNTALDIPDMPIRLFADPKDSADGFIIELYSPIFSYIAMLVKNYLGGYLVFDANATNGGGSSDKNGCWRLKTAQRPDGTGKYTALAQFVTNANWTSSVFKSKTALASWLPYVNNKGNSVPVAPIRYQTMVRTTEKPEGNQVIVVGTVAASSQLSVGQSKGLSCTVSNYVAAHFYDAQPVAVNYTHPDYEDGVINSIVIVDQSLTTQQAVEFVARRTFDLSCHTRYTLAFTAPLLLVTDAADTLQIRPRPLQFGDCVMVGTDTYFVSTVVIDYSGTKGGTRNIMCQYELFQVPALQTVGNHPMYKPNMNYAPTVLEHY